MTFVGANSVRPCLTYYLINPVVGADAYISPTIFADNHGAMWVTPYNSELK